MNIVAIIPAFRGANTISACIDGLTAAGFAASDILVVDDASPDDTALIARGKGVAVLRRANNDGAASARNAGAAACSGSPGAVACAGSPGDVLVFVDADVIVASDCRQVIVRTFKDFPELDAIFGTYDADPAAPQRVSRFRNLLHRHVHLQNAGEATTFWTGLGAVKRAAFDSVAGFHPDQAMMEDVRFGMDLSAAGKRIALLPELQGKHLKRWSLRGMIRTDLLHRAIPWARLLRARGSGLPENLNIDRASRLSVVASGVLVLACLALVVAPAAALCTIILGAAGIGFLNRRFLAMMYRIDGWAGALSALPLLWVHYICAGLGYAWVLLRG